MLHDLNTYLHKAIPDTKLTIRKYLDVKFEYLVRCQCFEWVQFHCDDFHCAKAALFCVTQHLVSFSHTAWRSKRWMMRSTAVLWVDILSLGVSRFFRLEEWLSSFFPAGHGGAAVSCQHRQLRIPLGAEMPAGGASSLRQDEEGCYGENRAAGPETWFVFCFVFWWKFHKTRFVAGQKVKY